jgi:succinoglycan biosynthesis transport protein ExoP
MIPGKTYKPEDFLRAAWRRRFMIVVPIALSAVAAATWSLTQPNEYRSETTLLVAPQGGADNVMAAKEVTPLEDRLYTIRQQLVSHDRLMQLVESAGLYQDWRKANPAGDVAERMRRDVNIEIVKGNPRRIDGTYFKISFVSTSPETAAMVTSRLADLFVRENAADRQNAARTTAAFIETQLSDARAKLDEQENKVEAYRERYAPELPSTLQSNLESLRRTDTQLQNLEAALSTVRAQRVTLESNIAAAELPVLQGAGGAAARRAGTSISAQLDAARSDLKALELHLTAEHPDVIRARRRVQALEERGRAEGAPQSADGGVLSPADVDRRQHLQELQSQLKGLDQQIADKEQGLPGLHQAIAMYQARLDAIPRHEAESAALTRDEATLQAVYQKLLESRENAGIVSKLEAEQNGRFKVIEPANVPVTPFRPDRREWVLLGALFGLGLGIGLAALLEFLDSSLRTDGDVIAALGLPVLAMIPVMHTSGEVTSRRQLGAAVSAVVVTLVVSALVYVW